MSQSNHSQSATGFDESPNIGQPQKLGRQASDGGSDDVWSGVPLVRRASSVSNSSSQDRDAFYPRRKLRSLGLVEMDSADVPEQAIQGGVGEEERPIYVWTGTSDHATVLRISFKRRIAEVWLEAYALKSFVELNLTAFTKILKKYVADHIQADHLDTTRTQIQS